MVIAIVAREIVRQSLKGLARYYRFEGKAFAKLYTGFPRARSIGRGVRHGLTSGSVIGTFINPAEDMTGNGVPTRQRPSPYQFPQKRGGRKFGSRSRNKYGFRQYYRRCRPSGSRKRRGSNYR